jgi:serine protease inhibitor
MKMLFLLPLTLLMAFSIIDKKQELTPKEIKLSPEQVQIIDGANRFGFDLFREVTRSTDQSENVFISPMSVHMALAMAWNGAAGKTRNQMAEAMYFPQVADPMINEGYKRLIADLLALDEQVAIEIANSIWYRNNFSVKRNFLGVNRDYFNAEVSALDFGDPGSKDIINNWVAEKTHDRISQIVDEIERDHVMFLINAIYFKGMWENEFRVQNTRNRSFSLADGSQKEVMTMETTSRYAYTERSGYRVLELPYGRGNFSMLVFLPDPGTDVNGLIEKLDIEEWNSLATEIAYHKAEVNLHLPRFGFSFEAELKQALMKLGIADAFMPGPADFSGISDEEIYISRVRHKSFVEVNEEGTEAAAVTSIEFRETSISIPVQFHVDRPFVFALKEKYTNSLMFIGKVMDPQP